VGQAYQAAGDGRAGNAHPPPRGSRGRDRIQGSRAADRRWDEIETALRNSAGRPLRITVLREGHSRRLVGRGSQDPDIFEKSEAWDWAPSLDLEPHRKSFRGSGQQAGIRLGIASWRGGTPSREWDHAAKIIHASPGKPSC